MNSLVEQFLEDGCGRCDRYKTEECSVRIHLPVVLALRTIAMESGLEEEIKWANPCYTYQGNNIFMISALKDYAALSFFNGALLMDDSKMLFAPGNHSQAARMFRFTNERDVIKNKDLILSYIYEAIENEKLGKKVAFKKTQEPFPQELLEVFEEDEEYKEAFERLTPGRQRSYLLHFNAAKQSKTKINRILKFRQKVFLGKGMNEY